MKLFHWSVFIVAAVLLFAGATELLRGGLIAVWLAYCFAGGAGVAIYYVRYIRNVK